MQYLEFDPANPEHMDAYRSLVLEGRQHPTLRFSVGTFESVPQMMIHRISQHFSQIQEQVIPSAKPSEDRVSP